ncbi:MAG: sigma-54 dependent transcriptional regulator [Tannerellaceae bacterium]|nr:sigma-54 dependent transcriptional regulator [Tannerellaceae bacterium]
MPSILIVEDDLFFSDLLKKWLMKKHYQVNSVSSVTEARKSLLKNSYDLVLTDLRIPSGEEGINLIQWSKKYYPDIPWIMLTNYAEHQTAVKAIKSGACDYLAKPVNPHILEEVIPKYIRIPVQTLQNLPAGESYLTGNHPAIRKVYEQIRIVAPTNMNVLIMGSSGTGKEHIARLIHEQSVRGKGPFVAVDCGAIPKDIALSEFFGHVKGSFTSAYQDKEGAFMVADGGTLFLDEIGNLPYEVQVQLLRAIEDRKIKPVGSTKEKKVNVRIIAATNEDLKKAVSGKYFREDLYFRLKEFDIRLPDLRERKEDILQFTDYFLKIANEELYRSVEGLDPETVRIFMNYDWPGNIRQLKNEVRRATLLSTGKYIMPEDLSEEILETMNRIPVALSEWQRKEAEIIESALKANGYNQSRTARQMGIDRKTLYHKIRAYHIFIKKDPSNPTSGS